MAKILVVDDAADKETEEMLGRLKKDPWADMGKVKQALPPFK